ncbi:uncharacterized protein LOC106133686 [Amyelois transitella]|uniref:uncharacterized protein LOC106133686 n=1 Tax=Amyelois transitella TaxID=680683 RepID=UPI00067E068A|nr:uncharacterized protein LOC106133686 [Amyelois transitella]
MDNTSFEPMDVDVSASSTALMDVSYDESQVSSVEVKEKKPTPAYSVKVYHLVKKTDKNSYNKSHFVVSLIVIISLSIFTYQFLNINCSGELDSHYLKEKLYKRVYGQYTAVTDIVNAIDNESRTKILFFYGGTGVGKTYTISLLLESKWNYTNVYHYTMPSFVSTFTTELMIGLTMCNTAVFVVDDLIPADLIHIKSHITEIVQKNNEMNKKIIVIMVFNCDNSDGDYIRKCDAAFYKEIENSFNNVNAFKQYVKFEELSEQHLKKCIEDELGERLDAVRFKNILQNFNVSVDGCKGVNKKIKMLSSL